MAEKATDDYRKADADINLSRAEVEKVGVKQCGFYFPPGQCVIKSVVRLAYVSLIEKDLVQCLFNGLLYQLIISHELEV